MSKKSEERKLMRNKILISSRDNRFSFRKRTKLIPLPFCAAYPNHSSLEDCLETAIQIEEAIDAFDNLIGIENNSFVPQDIKNSRSDPKSTEGKKEFGTIPVRYLNRSSYFIFKNNHNKKYVNNPWLKMEQSPHLGTIYYTEDSVEIHISKELQQLASMFSEELPPVEQKHTQFLHFTDELTKNIDNLFIQQGYEPTEKMRINLISLAYGSTEDILGKQEIQRLLGTTLKTHTITNPNLIHLAAKGCNDSMLKVFYAYDIYPETMEDMLELTSIPFELFYKIWTGEK